MNTSGQNNYKPIYKNNAPLDSIFHSFYDKNTILLNESNKNISRMTWGRVSLLQANNLKKRGKLVQEMVGW